MNRDTFKSKTGITSIITVVMTALGIYSGAVPLIGGTQTIITGLLALFLRDGIATATKATEENTRVTLAAAEQIKNNTEAVGEQMQATMNDAVHQLSDKAGA